VDVNHLPFLRDSTEGGAIIGLAFGKHRPDRACQLVGYRRHGHVVRSPGQQRRYPRHVPVTYYDGSRPVHEQSAQVHVPPFGQPQLSHLATGAALPGNQSSPGGKFAPGLERRGFSHGGYRCRGRQQPHAGYLAKHLSRAFEKPTTCNKFSSHERIGISQHFLSETTHSVAYIAEKVGFSRASNFATAFRKHCNMSPISYRKTIVQKRG